MFFEYLCNQFLHIKVPNQFGINHLLRFAIPDKGEREAFFICLNFRWKTINILVLLYLLGLDKNWTGLIEYIVNKEWAMR